MGRQNTPVYGLQVGLCITQKKRLLCNQLKAFYASFVPQLITDTTNSLFSLQKLQLYFATLCMLGLSENIIRRQGDITSRFIWPLSGCWVCLTLDSGTDCGITGRGEAILHTAHCTLHTVHCTLHTAHCTLHTAHCTPKTLTLKSVHYTLYTT